MPRHRRICIPGIPQHIIQRGINKQSCFNRDGDYGLYLKLLDLYAQEFQVNIHAWVLMTNHVHLLCTPTEAGATSKMMQAIGRKYVSYFNLANKRTGGLWEGRFKSCLVDSDEYLLAVYRYIEMNPVRAKMVLSPEQYKWSSFHVNALGRPSELCTPHPVYQSLGLNKSMRCSNYLKMFEGNIANSVVLKIRGATNTGKVFGSEGFIQQIEMMTKMNMRLKGAGRPSSS